MDEFPYQLQLRIDWSEIDRFGHVNNLAILKYAQSARVKLLEEIGLMQLQIKEKKGPILASLTSQFRKPLYYPGNVTVFSKIQEIGNSSFIIVHRVLNDSNEIAAEISDVIVFYDFQTNLKMKLTEEIRKKLTSTSPVD